MKSAVLTLAVLVLCTSGAMAAAFPPLAGFGATASYQTLVQTPTQIDLSSHSVPPSTLQMIVAAGATAVSSGDYVLSTTLHFDQVSTTAAELGLIARADAYSRLYWTSVNPNNGYLALDFLDGSPYVPVAAPMQIPGFDKSKDYKLVFNLSGSSITAAVFDGATQVAAISGSNSGLASGNMIGVNDVCGSPYSQPVLSGTFLNSTVNPVLMGDANLDGTTNVADLTRLLNNYNLPGKTWLDGDFDNNGTVDVGDLTALLNKYNVSVGGVAQPGSLVASGTVPEPSTVCLLLTGCAMLGVYWLRKP